MAQYKVLATKYDGVSVNPRTQRVGENSLLKLFYSESVPKYFYE